MSMPSVDAVRGPLWIDKALVPTPVPVLLLLLLHAFVSVLQSPVANNHLIYNLTRTIFDSMHAIYLIYVHVHSSTSTSMEISIYHQWSLWCCLRLVACVVHLIVLLSCSEQWQIICNFVVNSDEDVDNGDVDSGVRAAMFMYTVGCASNSFL